MTELLAKLTLHEVKDKLRSKEVKPSEVLDSLLKRIEALDGKVGSYLYVDAEGARAKAKKFDELFAQKSDLPPLAGIPMSPKDIYLTKGMPTTCASKILKGYIPPYNSTVINKCEEAGLYMVGKINLDEFAMGSSNENSAYQSVKNPWNLACVPGGSSGGSAAALAADLCIATLGTDTGGSIRQPAAFCGVVGLKPTYGRVSRYGVIAFASSLDQMGPMTKDVEDTALLMNVISGYDKNDSTSVNMSVPDYTKFLNLGIKGKKIGIPKEYFADGLDGEVRTSIDKAIQTLKDLGAEIQEVSLPTTQYATAVYYILAPAEASSNLARYDGIRYGFRADGNNLKEIYENSKTAGFGPEVKRRIMLGTYVLSAGYYDAYYIKAQKARTVITNDFNEAFKKVDVLLTPTTPTTAFKIGEKSSDPLQMYLSDICTIAVNLAGLPGMSLPCGFDSKGLPIGMQLIGKAFDEGTLIQVGHAYEQATPWHKKKPIF
ncbi:Asp-tRNA(Asn)/Glu-tRNA(Gln) amidotransferase subunit GatA [bacterium]|nr:Asp-tRNA(Asn)/Glu-tRNA(Gln) amidotransferase subunit GatA [bacterium]